MTRIFISYSHIDRSQCNEIREWLENNGWENEVFVDENAKTGLTGGSNWRAALKQAASRCEAVILLISKNWINSQFCRGEFQLSDKLSKSIIPVRITSELPFIEIPNEITDSYMVVEKANTTDVEFYQVLKRALENAGAGPENFKLVDGRPPYPGLSPLMQTDSALFFGRDAEVLAAMDTIREIRTSQNKRLFTLLGSSGAGKSSLLRAGLWPRLRRDDRNFFTLPVIRPLNAPLSGSEGLWKSLESAAQDPLYSNQLPEFFPKTQRALELEIDNSPSKFVTIIRALKHAASTLIDDSHYEAMSLLLVDQAEELFTSTMTEEVDTFFEVISNSLTLDRNFAVIFAIRSDMFPNLQLDTRIQQREIRPFNLSPMSRDGMAQVIMGPAERLGFDVAPDLVQRLLNDSKGADALPLLAFTLEKLYDERLKENALYISDYNALGGVEGAIEMAMEGARVSLTNRMGERPPAEIDDLIRKTLLPNLVRINEVGEVARRIAYRTREVFSEEHEIVLDILIQERLLTSNISEETPTIEVSHEAILRNWELMRHWLRDERAFLEWREQAERNLALYETKKGDLLSGRLLASGREYIKEQRKNLDERIIRYIENSVEEDERAVRARELQREALQKAEINAAQAREKMAHAEMEAERRLATTAKKNTKIFRYLAGTASIIALLAGALGWRAYQGEVKITQEIYVNDTQRIASLGQRYKSEGFSTVGEALAWMSLYREIKTGKKIVSPDGVSALRKGKVKFMYSIEGESLIDAPNSHHFLLLGKPNGVGIAIWDTKRRERIFFDKNAIWKKKSSNGSYTDVEFPPRFSRDEKSIIYETLSNKVKVWNIGSNRFEREIDKNTDDPIIFSPNFEYMLQETKDNHLSVVSFKSGQSLSTLKIPSGLPSDIQPSSFTPDNSTVTVEFLGDRYTVSPAVQFDVNSGNVVEKIEFGNAVFPQYHPNSNFMLVCPWNQGVHFRKIKEMRQKFVTVPGDSAFGCSFSPSGKFIVSGATHVGYVTHIERHLEEIRNEKRSQDDDTIELKGSCGNSCFGVVYSSPYFQNIGTFDFQLDGIKSQRIQLAQKDGLMASAVEKFPDSLDLIISVYNTDDFSLKGQIQDEEYGVSVYFLDPTGKTLITLSSARSILSLWDISANIRTSTVSLTDDTLLGLKFDTTGRYLYLEIRSSGLSEGNGEQSDILSDRVEVWDLEADRPFSSISLSSVKSITPLLPSSDFLIGLEGGHVVSIGKYGNEVSKVKPHNVQGASPALSTNKEYVASGGWDGKIYIHHIDSGRGVYGKKAHELGVLQVSFIPGSQTVASLSADGTIILHDAIDGNSVGIIHGSGETQISMIPIDEENVITATYDGYLRQLSVKQGGELSRVRLHYGGILSAVPNSDHTVLATSSDDGTAKLVSLPDGRVIHVLDHGGDTVDSISWSRDGKRVLTITKRGDAKVWDSVTGTLLAAFKHGSEIIDQQFFGNGSSVVTVTSNSILYHWDVDTSSKVFSKPIASTAKLVSLNSKEDILAIYMEAGDIDFYRIDNTPILESVDNLDSLFDILRPLSAAICSRFNLDTLPNSELICVSNAEEKELNRTLNPPVN